MRHAIEFVYANIQEQHVAENSRNIECSNSIAGVAACLIHREMRSINMHGSGKAHASMQLGALTQHRQLGMCARCEISSASKHSFHSHSRALLAAKPSSNHHYFKTLYSYPLFINSALLCVQYFHRNDLEIPWHYNLIQTNNSKIERGIPLRAGIRQDTNLKLV